MKKVKKTVSLILAFAMIMSLCACGGREKKSSTEFTTLSVSDDSGKYLAGNLLDNVEAGKAEAKEPDEKFIASAADFSIEMFRMSIKDDLAQGKNVMISPNSIMTCLTMTANGANGNTLSEMEGVICPGFNISDFNEYLFYFNEALQSDNEVEVNIANSIWIREDINAKEEFLEKVKTYYDAAVFKRDFSPDTARDINLWVNEKTNGMIDKLIENIADSAIMYLINAIAFEGEWLEPYEDTQINENGKFTDCKGAVQTVNMLMSTEKVYMENDDSRAFLKYYRGGKYAFMGILPDEDIDLNDYIQNMNGEKFIELFESRNRHSNTEVLAKIPEFAYDYDILLNDSLKNMGMNSAFGDGADFSKMVDADAYIDRVIHKTHIELDRKGTKAAAVTAVELQENCAIPDEQDIVEITLDRPFVYAIVDTDTGLPVFIGAVNSIE